MRAESRHDQIRRQIKHHIAHVEQCEARRDLVRCRIQHSAQVVSGIFVHGLREANIGADCGAEEVEDPEWGNYAVI